MIISCGGQNLGPEPQDPRTRGGSFLHPSPPPAGICTVLNCFSANLRVLGRLLSLLKPFCFCIKGREASFFFSFSFWVIFTLPKSEKCPNQIGGQVATGNHSTKPVFFFFHFFLKPHAEGKLTECQLAALHTESPTLSKHGEQSRK